MRFRTFMTGVRIVGIVLIIGNVLFTPPTLLNVIAGVVGGILLSNRWDR